MTSLVSFPSRIRFVNQDGTLTQEAYRTLQELVNRTGVAIGSVGVDVFGDISGGASNGDVYAAHTDVVQQGSSTPGAVESVTVTGTPFTYTAAKAGKLVIGGGCVYTIEFIRGSALTLPVTFGVFSMEVGDQIRVTYSTETTTYDVIPTIQFIET